MEVCDKLDSILMSIEGATDQAKVLEAFKHGLKALEAANSGASLEETEEVMSDVSDCVRRVEDIATALASSESVADVSTEELEAELEELCKAEDSKERQEKDAENENEDLLIKQLEGLKVPSDEDVKGTSSKTSKSKLLETG